LQFLVAKFTKNGDECAKSLWSGFAQIWTGRWLGGQTFVGKLEKKLQSLPVECPRKHISARPLIRCTGRFCIPWLVRLAAVCELNCNLVYCCAVIRRRKKCKLPAMKTKTKRSMKICLFLLRRLRMSPLVLVTTQPKLQQTSTRFFFVCQRNYELFCFSAWWSFLRCQRRPWTRLKASNYSIYPTHRAKKGSKKRQVQFPFLPRLLNPSRFSALEFCKSISCAQFFFACVLLELRSTSLFGLSALRKIFWRRKRADKKTKLRIGFIKTANQICKWMHMSVVNEVDLEIGGL
jgi:hypothetical protein